MLKHRLEVRADYSQWKQPKNAEIKLFFLHSIVSRKLWTSVKTDDLFVSRSDGGKVITQRRTGEKKKRQASPADAISGKLNKAARRVLFT